MGAGDISRANVLITKYVFTGETRCPPGDPRLTQKTVSHGYCRTGGAPCLQSVAAYPAPFDPCAGI